LPGASGNLEAEVGGVAGDVPVGELVLAGVAQPFLHLVGGLQLQAARAVGRGAPGPVTQELDGPRVGQAEEVVLGGLQHRLGAGDGRVRVLQLGGGIGRTTGLAVVAVLIRRAALGALALDEAVGQEHLLHRIVELLDGPGVDEPGAVAQAGVDVFGVPAVFVAVGGVVVVEGHAEITEITAVFAMHPVDELLGRQAFLFGPQHHRRAVGVVCAHVMHRIAAHALVTHPDVGLDVAHQVAEVDVAVGVGQGVGDENRARGSHGRHAASGFGIRHSIKALPPSRPGRDFGKLE
jgi:hypothetical protein